MPIQSLLKKINHEISETWKFRYVIHSFVQSTLKLKYRRSVLGFGWSLLSPIMSYSVIGLVFSHIAKMEIPNYIGYLFSGALLYNFFVTVIGQSSNIMIHNENYIKKIYIPKLVFILNTVLVEFINFTLSFIAISIMAFILGKFIFSSALIILPIISIVSLFFIAGLSITISITAVYFRDLIHIIPILLQMLFYVTPIMFYKGFLPERLQPLIKLNPFFYFVEAFRTPLYEGHFITLKLFGVLCLISTFSFSFGIWLLKKHENKIIFKL